jgi:hypothetical protein
VATVGGANTRFPGRTDLVLLLVDTDRLAAEVSFERSEPDGPVFPHVYGPLDLEAVFEATRYRPASDGRFHPHVEASGFAAHGARTLAGAKRRSLEVMAGFAGRSWVAGGWHLRLAAPGAALLAWDGSGIHPPMHQLWARHGPGRPSSPDDFAADPTMVGFLLERSTGDRWVVRRHPAITRSLEEVGATTEGVAFVRPEIALLYKAKGSRFKGRRDFDRVLPHLDTAARTWLASALDQAHPGHVWRERL